MAEELRLPPPDEMLEGCTYNPPQIPSTIVTEEPEPAPSAKPKRTAKPKAEAKDEAPIDQSAINAAMQVLRAAGLEVVAKNAPKGPCPPDKLTGREGYYQTTTDANGRQHTVRVYSGFKEGEKGKRPDPVPTVARGRR